MENGTHGTCHMAFSVCGGPYCPQIQEWKIDAGMYNFVCITFQALLVAFRERETPHRTTLSPYHHKFSSHGLFTVVFMTSLSVKFCVGSVFIELKAYKQATHGNSLSKAR